MLLSKPYNSPLILIQEVGLRLNCASLLNLFTDIK